MAVYTDVPEDDIKDFLDLYDLGAYESHEGIEQGVSNSNYHLYTEKGHFILTLFEAARVEPQDVQFFLHYADVLKQGGVPVPSVQKDKQGRLMNILCRLPACIMEFLDGKDIPKAEITAEHCKQAGAMLGKMHKAATGIEDAQQNRYGLEKWNAWYARYKHVLDKSNAGFSTQLSLLLTEINHKWPDGLPKGVIHGDLFPDNVFFKDGKVSGIIDFHFACTELFVYDLAILVNAWCFDREINFMDERFQAVIAGYQSERPLTPDERKALPLMFKAAALRFFLSRLEETMEHKKSDKMTPHDPKSFVRRLEFFLNGG